MRKQLKKALAFVLSVAMLLSCMMTMVWTGVASADTYTGTLLDIAYVGKKSGAPYELDLEPNSTALTPKIPSSVLTVNWSGAMNAENGSEYLFLARTQRSATEDTATAEEAKDELFVWPDKQSFMFYAKVPMGSPENSLFIKFASAEAAGASSYMGVTPKKKVYYLQKGTEEWLEGKTGVSYSAANSKTIGGSIPLPAGFEGWIRLPWDSIYQKAEMDKYVRRIDMYVEKVGSNYTADGVQVGAFMWVNSDEPRTKVSVGGVTTSLLVDFPHHKGHLIADNVSAIGNATVEKAKNETGFTTGYTYAISAQAATDNAGLSLNAAADDAAVLTKDGSLIFYAGMRLGGGNKLSVQVGGTKLTAGATVYTKNIGQASWYPVTVDAAGSFALPAKFEGYLMIPAASWGFTANQKLQTVSFTLDHVEVSDDLARIGSVLISDKSSAELMHVRLDTDTRYVYLNKEAYYHTQMLPTGTVTTTPNDQNFFEVSDKNIGDDIVPGLNGGYDYEISIGSAQLGTHKIPHAGTENENPPPSDYYTAVTTPIAFTFAGSDATNYLTDLVNATAPSTDLIPTIPSYYITAKTKTALAGKQLRIKFGTNCTFGTGQAILFYFEGGAINNDPTDDNNENGLRFRWGSTNSASNELKAGELYYTLDVNAETKEWETKSVPADFYMPVAKDFKGWFLIPYSSFTINDSETLTNLWTRLYFSKVAADYEFSFGSPMVVSTDSPTFTKVMLSGETEARPLFGQPVQIPMDTEGYLGTPVTLPTPDNGTTSTATLVTDNPTGLTTKVPSSYVKWLWSEQQVDAHMDTSNTTGRNAQNSLKVKNLKLTAGNALLLYVKLPAGAPNTPLGFRFSVGKEEHYNLATNATVYTLPVTQSRWVTNKTTTVSGRYNTGYVTLPAGFEGWVRIPYESIDQPTTTLDVTTLRLYVGNVTSAFTNVDDQFSVGAVTVVDKGLSNRSMLTTLDGAVIEAVLGSGIDDSYKYAYIFVDRLNGEKVMTADVLTEDMYMNIPLTQSTVLKTDEALMFYLRQTGRVDSTLHLDLGKDLTLAAGATYRLCANNTGLWAPGKIGPGSTLTVKAGFEGWVRIPFASFANADGDPLTDEVTFEQIRVMPYELGGAYGSVRIGMFLVTDYATSDLYTMRVGVSEAQELVLLRAYTGSTPTVQRVNAPKDTQATRIPRAALKEGYIYELSAKTAKELPDADLGFEMLFFGASGSLDESRAILAYVKIPAGKDNVLSFGNDQAVLPGKEWYALKKGANSTWQKYTADENGGMVLPAGFEGYVRVPATSLKVTNATVSTFRFAFRYVGGEYGSPLFGSVTFIDNAAYNFTTYYSQTLAYPESLCLADRLEGYVLSGTVQTDSDSNNRLSVNMLPGNPLTPGVNGGFAFEFAPKGEAFVLEDGVTSPRVTFTLDTLSGKVMGGSDSILFYVKTTAANQLWVQARGENAAAMQVGNVYYTLAKGDGYWTTAVADRNGYLTFEEGFEGWVRIPYSELKTSLNLQGTLKDIRMAFRFVGGAYGNPQVGTIILADSNVNSGELRLYGSNTSIRLYGDNQKAEPLRNDVACWESVTIPFVGLNTGDAYPLTTTLTAGSKEEAAITFENVVTDGMTPFKAPGIDFSADAAITFSASDTPRYIAKMGISTEDGVGLVLYVKLPKRAGDEVGEEDQYADSTAQKLTNNLWVQLNTAQGRTVALRHAAMLKTLEKGSTTWRNRLVSNRQIQLPDGFEGYVYIPFTSLGTANNNTTGTHFVLERDNMITALNIGFGEHGGELGDAQLGGIFIAKNNAFSRDGAYVDGDAVCRNLFTGVAVDPATVKQTVYDAPVPGGVYEQLELPEATNPENYIFIEDITASSVTAVWEATPQATRYRVDVYKAFALPISHNGGTGYEHLYSLWVENPVAVCEGLITSNQYLVQVLAFNGSQGIEVLPSTSAIPEGDIVGGMWADDDEDYKYPWFTDEDLSTEDSDLDDWDELEQPDGEAEDGTIIVEEVILRRKVKKGLKAWQWALIIGGGVVVAAGAALLVIVFVKKKRAKCCDAIPTEETPEGGEQE